MATLLAVPARLRGFLHRKPNRQGKRRLLKRIASSLVLALVGFTPALAQQEAPCTATLETAQTYYVDQDFSVAEVLLRECLNRPDVDDTTAIQVHRLLALVYLRQDKTDEAETIILRLLGISFDYTPDPVLDPPSYVALVESIKEPLRIEREQAPAEVEPPPPVPEAALEAQRNELRLPSPFRTSRALYLHATLGAGSYGGERGADGAWWLSEFTKNSGVSLSLGASVSVNQMLDASLTYRLHHIPRLFTLRSVDRQSEVGPQIEPGASSKLVHLFALLGRAFYPLEGRASSYVELGVSGSISRINDTVRTGFGPRGGFGLDLEITPQLVGFMGLSATMIFPGNAVDHIDSRKGSNAQKSHDLMSFAEVGVRYRVTGW